MAPEGNAVRDSLRTGEETAGAGTACAVGGLALAPLCGRGPPAPACDPTSFERRMPARVGRGSAPQPDRGAMPRVRRVVRGDAEGPAVGSRASY